MASDDAPEQFPEVSQKLNAAKKLSAFEKDKQAQDEKRRREKAETDAALKQFEDDFGGGDDADDRFDGFPPSVTPRGPGSGPGGYGGSSFGQGGGPPSGPRRAGPGSLGPIPGPPPPSLKRKRALDELREQQEARREQQALVDDYTNAGLAKREGQDGYQAQEEEPEDVAPRPTVQLSSLPPATTADDVKALLRDHLEVHSVLFQQPTGPAPAARKSLTAIATLSSETSTSRIDTVVSTLKDKYLGFGFHLSLSRHLSSTALLPTLSVGPNATSSEPFGAEKAAKDAHSRPSMRNAPPPSHFAPPDSFEAVNRAQPPPNANVVVKPPQDIKTIRAIHTIVDRLLTEPDSEHALEMEAMLMSLPEVQEDERFSFLYDSKSAAGVYYRYLLWNDTDSPENVREREAFANRIERLHDDVVIDWTPPNGELPFADLSKLGEALDHRDYESSEEDSEDGESRTFNNGRRDGEGQPQPAGKSRLTPLQLAKFAWFLSRMPASQAKLRMSEVSEVTSFAINNAGAGAEEIVDMLVLNVERPFTTTQCAKYEDEDVSQDEDDVYEPDEELPTIESTPLPEDGSRPTEKKEVEDPSQAKLVALYLINDILHNSSTAGVRNAWKYRLLFENAFRRQRTFEHLGRLEKELGWGRMKSQQWRNRVLALFEIWENSSIFATDVFEALKKDFFEQPSSGDDTVEEAAVKLKNGVDMTRFKRIDGTASPAALASPVVMPAAKLDNLEGRPMDVLDGTPADVAMSMDNPNHDPKQDLDRMDVDGPQSKTSESMPILAEETTIKPSFSLKASSSKPQAQIEPRRRKQAEDMFADSDED